eukprot:350585-Chlamydomonas_euryale.AAC.2
MDKIDLPPQSRGGRSCLISPLSSDAWKRLATCNSKLLLEGYRLGASPPLPSTPPPVYPPHIRSQLVEPLAPHLEVFRQLCPPGVARVHRDEHAARVAQRDLAALKRKELGTGLERVLDREQLLRDDRQHLDVDAVELVKARPRAALRQTTEELAHELRPGVGGLLR